MFLCAAFPAGPLGVGSHAGFLCWRVKTFERCTCLYAICANPGLLRKYTWEKSIKLNATKGTLYI